MNMYRALITLAEAEKAAGMSREAILEADIARAKENGYFRAAATLPDGERPAVFMSDKRLEFMGWVLRFAQRNGHGSTQAERDAFFREVEAMPPGEHLACIFGQDVRHAAIPDVRTHTLAKAIAELDWLAHAEVCTFCVEQPGRYVHLEWNSFPNFLNHYYARMCPGCSEKYLEVNLHELKS